MAGGNTFEPPAVGVIEQLLRQAQNQALQQTSGATVSEPLASSPDLAERITALKEELHRSTAEAHVSLVFEAAVRRVFYDILKTTTADGESAGHIWTFLDVLLLICEYRETGRTTIWYVVEELVESQTADCCRIVFDYLESRRERLTEREFQASHLIILRTCNELLRRLSRAEDATFCGRVFFFLFQTFPLGEQSSVNLRGEFHTDNITLFDEDPSIPVPAADKPLNSDGQSSKQKPQTANSESLGAFYPVFWQLQKDFSAPTRLIESEQNFTEFKSGLETTIETFSKTPVVRTQSAADDSRGVKRKRGDDDGTTYQGDYNPKYLTSKDLFSLELSDISFQRHILMQALILLDFLLSLTEEAQKKLDGSGIAQLNSAVNYKVTLSEENKTWILAIKTKITNYLQQGHDGSFFYRMVSTVLARDKNWIWWKIQRCPQIVTEAVGAEDYVAAQKGVAQATAPRRIRAKPMGAMDLTFLSEANSVSGLDSMRDRARFRTPTVDELLEQVSREELDLDFADGEEKEMIQSQIDSLTWRAIRTSSRLSLAKLDKLEPGKSLREVFGVEKPAQEPEGSATKTPEVQVA